MKRLKEDLLVQFSISGFVIMLAIALIISMMLTNRLNRNVELLKEHGAAMMAGDMIKPADPFSVPNLARNFETLRWMTYGTIGGGVVLLYLGLVYIVARGSRNMLRQQSALARANTDLQAANERLQESSVELERANNDLEKSAVELERSNTDLEQFAYVASHDLQEPLRMVGSYCQLLERRYKDQLDSDAHEFIAYAVDGANRMHTLINDLLTYSRVGSRQKPFDSTNCQEIYDQVLTDLTMPIERCGAVVTHGDLPTVMSDATQLRQVFQNLLTNAIKFQGDNPPQIHVDAERKNGRWLFSVRDNGIGIDSRYFDRIFGIFERLHDRGETQYPGTGIGLAVCKKIVERHGGSIWAESQPGAGATFFFTIPA